jgi:hypothetical protein
MPLAHPPIIRLLSCVSWAMAMDTAIDPGALKGAIARWVASDRWPHVLWDWEYVLFMAAVVSLEVLGFDRIARWPGLPRGHALVNAFAYTLIVLGLVFLSGHHSPFVATGVAAFTQAIGSLVVGGYLGAKALRDRAARPASISVDP